MLWLLKLSLLVAEGSSPFGNVPAARVCIAIVLTIWQRAQDIFHCAPNKWRTHIIEKQAQRKFQHAQASRQAGVYCLCSRAYNQWTCPMQLGDSTVKVNMKQTLRLHQAAKSHCLLFRRIWPEFGWCAWKLGYWFAPCGIIPTLIKKKKRKNPLPHSYSSTDWNSKYPRLWSQVGFS